MAFAQRFKRLKLFLQVSTGQFTVKEFESSEQKIIAIGSLIPHYMQWIRKDITDSKDRHKSSFFQTRNEIAGSIRTRNPRWRESGLVLCMAYGRQASQSRVDQAKQKALNQGNPYWSVVTENSIPKELAWGIPTSRTKPVKPTFPHCENATSGVLIGFDLRFITC